MKKLFILTLLIFGINQINAQKNISIEADGNLESTNPLGCVLEYTLNCIPSIVSIKDASKNVLSLLLSVLNRVHLNIFRFLNIQ